MVDVDRLEAPRPQILKFVRHARRAKNHFSRACIQRRIPDEKSRMALDDDEGLVIRVHVKAWPGTYFVGTVRKHRRRPA
ncbi:hypothetical protein PIB19_09415 [Sphingomonas sp. 7/4-4]|nr:hypothetical protein [Sphingomonas sp. 7/4-4]WBY09493.1 hypothetical protein PIB19_09415 [Sphingomonas sp. 7/4-4]